MKLAGNLDMLDWTGRAIRHGKSVSIPNECQPILDRIGLGVNVWCELVGVLRNCFAVLPAERIR